MSVAKWLSKRAKKAPKIKVIPMAEMAARYGAGALDPPNVAAAA